MKALLILLLLFAVGCNNGSSGGNTVSNTFQDTSTAPVTPGEPGTPTTPTNPTNPSPTNDAWTNEFMDLINAHRASIGLQVLTIDDGLNEIVQKHSDAMASGSVAFGHDGFSARCSAGRTALGGGNWCGENVAMGQKTPQAAFSAWMNSPGHKANIESSRATHTGLAYAKSASGTYYWTQLFLEY